MYVPRSLLCCPQGGSEAGSGSCREGGSRPPAPGSGQEVPGLTGVRLKGKVHP